MISIAVTKNGIDGTDVRLLKVLAKKFDFAYNISIPDSYNAAIRMVCNLNFFFAYYSSEHFFSPTTERQIYS